MTFLSRNESEVRSDAVDDLMNAQLSIAECLLARKSLGMSRSTVSQTDFNADP